jgi:hypothetical protein
VQLPVAGTDQGFYGRIIDGALLSFTKPQSVVILISVFLTVFLFFFMLLNVRWKSTTMIFSKNQPAVKNAEGTADSNTDNSEKVIIERDGIPYISGALFSGNSNLAPDQKLNSDFVRLVESVVGKSLPTPVPGQKDKP